MLLKQAFEPVAITSLLSGTAVPECYLLLIIIELKLSEQILPAVMQIEPIDVDHRLQTEFEDSLAVTQYIQITQSIVAHQKQTLVV